MATQDKVHAFFFAFQNFQMEVYKVQLLLMINVLFKDVAPESTQNINILFVGNSAENGIAERALDVALNYARRNRGLGGGARVDSVRRVVNAGSKISANDLLEELCKAYNDSLLEDKPPHVVVDTTIAGTASETVKYFTSALGLPTVSTSYGQQGDIRQWQNLSSEKLKYLLQIMPPGDLIPEVVRSLVQVQNISNAAVLYDDSVVMGHKYKSLLQNVPTRHVMSPVGGVAKTAQSIREQLTRLRDLDITNFFVIGRLDTAKAVLDAANTNKLFGRKFAWHVITKEKGALKCGCSNATVLLVKPEPDQGSRVRLADLKTTYSLTAEPELDAAFYFDLILRTIVAVNSMLQDVEWRTAVPYVTCDDYEETEPPVRTDLNLWKYMEEADITPSYAPISIEGNGQSLMEFSMKLEKVSIVNSMAVSAESVGSWKAGINSPIYVKNAKSLSKFTSVKVYRIVTVVQHPFSKKEGEEGKPAAAQRKYKGYCIDMIEEIRAIVGFEYEIYEAPDKKFGYMDEKGQWNGMVKELVEKRADIALSSMAVMAERENVVDFTVPYYDQVGITILMKKPQTETSLFKFLTVLEKDVWLCILAAYFFTSFLMWVFDRWSPYSYQNNKEKYKDDEEKREFDLKECLWFCMTSLTPQGGGEAPKNLSGRLVAATWWLFGFIIIASYTANLAAFLTVSRLDTPIESLDDLAKQYKIQYAPVNGSAAMTYFKRMADIEDRFYEIWKEMSLNDSLSDVERAKLAVWDYPVSDKYTKMWQAMEEATLPSSTVEAVSRVRASKSSNEGFAFLGDATDIRYLTMTNCDLLMVGEEFSRKPYAIAVQQGSPLKDQFNSAILQLLNKRKLEKLKEVWWNQNPERKVCEKQDEQSEGISVQNIGGVFIVIFVGIGLACVTLAFEYWWYRHKRSDDEDQGGLEMPDVDAEKQRRKERRRKRKRSTGEGRSRSRVAPEILFRQPGEYGAAEVTAPSFRFNSRLGDTLGKSTMEVNRW
ncbi:ionotropic receptor 25a [Ischnura elegans]|uniref:ionotropic receptor 25a n=1 Tax=Ischnura elegans TaxID=197161 RepID=UPI001ED8BF9A|nr:ionotropic receptor 25a [Ischnura elegans]